MKSKKGEEKLIDVWRPISIRDSWHVSQGGDCYYFAILHPFEKTTRKVDEILEDSTVRNVHRHAQA